MTAHMAAALRMVDKLLSERPDKVGHDFSEATRCLTAARDDLIAAWRHSGSMTDRQRLARINAVLSVIMGGHFPLGDIPWEMIEAARRHLAELAAEGTPPAGQPVPATSSSQPGWTS